MKKFKVELSSSFPFWWRFNLYMSVICFDDSGVQTDYISLVDEPYMIDPTQVYRSKPEGYNDLRPFEINTGESAKIVVYVYAIAQTLPCDRQISSSPPFEATLSISSEGEQILLKELSVDQLGGYTLAGLEISD